MMEPITPTTTLDDDEIAEELRPKLAAKTKAQLIEMLVASAIETQRMRIELRCTELDLTDARAGALTAAQMLAHKCDPLTLASLIESEYGNPFLASILRDTASAARKATGKKGADKVHNKPNGNRAKKEELIRIWLSGKYSSRQICADQEHKAIGMALTTARKALQGTPNPT